MRYDVQSLSEIDDFQELLSESANTVHMLIIEAQDRDKYDVYDYISKAQRILDMLQDRADQLGDDYE